MKISTKGRYGVRILLDLAIHENKEPRLIRDISESQKISEKYISRLVIDLRRGGLISSIRGAKGGFRLAKAPEDITLLEVVEVMEGTLSIVDCVRNPESCAQISGCATREVWERLNEEIRESMRKITLDEIIKNFKTQNYGRGFLDYCI